VRVEPVAVRRHLPQPECAKLGRLDPLAAARVGADVDADALAQQAPQLALAGVAGAGD
jgi:hypothetical protein